MVSAAEKRQYEEQGYLLKTGLLTEAECNALCAHVSGTIARVVREWDARPKATGRRGDGATGRLHEEPDYFRSTAREIGLFWERGTDPDRLAPEECERAISRLGHGLHVVDATFRRAAIFFHGCLYHGAAANESSRPRRAYAVHYAGASSRWSPFNWIDGAPGFVPLRERLPGQAEGPAPSPPTPLGPVARRGCPPSPATGPRGWGAPLRGGRGER
jgi:hypothetical protein